MDLKLRRKDQLKEYLYKYKYPHIPFFRIRHDHCRALGWDGAGKALASWIIASRAGKVKGVVNR